VSNSPKVTVRIVGPRVRRCIFAPVHSLPRHMAMTIARHEVIAKTSELGSKVLASAGVITSQVAQVTVNKGRCGDVLLSLEK
jgi:hypothetical protein